MKKSYIVLCFILLLIVVIGFFQLNKNNQSANQAATIKNVKAVFDKSIVLVNEPMPDIQLFDENGKDYNLNELKGKNIVLFFNRIRYIVHRVLYA